MSGRAATRMDAGSRRSAARAARILALVLVFAACAPFKRCAYSPIGRDGWQEPDRVVAALELQPGSHVADLGSGGGYFTFRLADAVGPEGRVFAVDVDDSLLEYIDERARKDGYSQVEVVRAAFDDPKLPEAGVDLIFTSNTYHHLEDRVAYFANARRYLRPGGRVAIVEFSGGWLGHATDPEQIRDEMREAGYREIANHVFLSRQSFLVFEPAGE